MSDHGQLMGLNNAFFLGGKVEAANPFAALLVPNDWVDAAADPVIETKFACSEDLEGTDSQDFPHETCTGSAQPSRGELLAQSQAQLVTAFDLYETMRGFMPRALRQQIHRSSRRGYDLAREKIPARSCSEAGIEEEACRCI